MHSDVARSRQIFLSYRRMDDAGHAGRLHDTLAHALPSSTLFMDNVGLIQPGDDFTEVIHAHVQHCDALLAIIGPRWLELLHAATPHKRDFVVFEIETALTSGRRVIPVLVGNARMPEAANLPACIRPLVKRQAFEIRPDHFKRDCEYFAEHLEACLAEPNCSTLPHERPTPRGAAPTPAPMPAWASNCGQDRTGPWADLQIGPQCLRFRRIPAGAFTMGSSHQEAHRYKDELPHSVRLSQHFWLAETPCTQVVWSRIRAHNPSEFQSPERPVEQVSWEDAQQFIAALNRRLAGCAQVRLPTEAEWEYACRAATDTPVYNGTPSIVGRHSASLLNAVAWYGGNSGHGFELAQGLPSHHWADKQFPHTMSGTRPVKLKGPNAFGLYDMLGNVWEWCQSWYGPYDPTQALDPTGPAAGTMRIARGAAWNSEAKFVRCALRHCFAPYHRASDVGFRLAITDLR